MIANQPRPLLLVAAALILGCGQGPRQPSAQPRNAASTPSGASPQVAAAASPSRGQTSASAAAGQAIEAAGQAQFDDVEERRGPYSISGQTLTVVLHEKRLRGQTGPDSQTLALIEVLNGAGEVQYREPFNYSVEAGAKEFEETCAAGVQVLEGSNGKGLLLDEGCLPSAPLSGGPWRILGVLNGKVTPIGKPLYTEGELGEFVPGAINRIGPATQILPDMLQIRVWTGYFFVSVPVRVDWYQGKLAMGQHCFYQTGHGMAEGGCEMPVGEVQRSPSDEDMTFVRLFPESNEEIGPPAHVVVKQDSVVEILAGKVLIEWNEEADAISLGVGDDIWVKVRIDRKEGWIHTTEDLNALGMYQSG
jgi:hypothetical protein